MATTPRPRAMIVEDDGMLCFLLREICAEAGWDVCGEAIDVTEALAGVDVERPDLLICDFALAGERNGLELLALVRQSFPDMTTIMLTGWDLGLLARFDDLAVADHLLRKPVMPTDLMQLLEQVSPAPMVGLANAA